MTPPVPKAGVPSCATAFPRFPCRNFSRQFVYEGGKRVRGGVFSSPLPPLPPPPRNFFNIRIRVGPPTRAQSLPRRRRLSLFRVRERNFSSRKTKPSPIGSIFHSRSQGEETKVRITFQRLINSFSSVSRLNDSSRDSCNLFWSLFLSLSEIVSFFLIERGVGKRIGLENEREKKEYFKELFVGTDFPSCGSVRSTSGKKREFPYGWDESLRFLINRLRSFLGPPSPLLSWMILTRWKLSRSKSSIFASQFRKGFIFLKIEREILIETIVRIHVERFPIKIRLIENFVRFIDPIHDMFNLNNLKKSHFSFYIFRVKFKRI